MHDLFEALHEAIYVYHDEDRGLLYVWHGGVTVNIFDATGKNIDCFSIDQKHKVSRAPDQWIYVRELIKANYSEED
jgi:hypothetical protein